MNGIARRLCIGLLTIIIVLSVTVTAGCVVLYLNPALAQELFPNGKIITLLPPVSHAQNGGKETSDEVYLGQSMFVGDSRTHAMDLYGYLDISQTIAEDGLCHNTALTKAFADLGDGNRYTMSEALAMKQPKRVFVGFGINGISYMSEDEFFSDYRTVINQIKSACPDADIIIESILPVSQYFSSNNPGMDNETIVLYNHKLQDLADEMGVYYIDTAKSVRDDFGALDAQYAAPDGLHLVANAYEQIFRVILSEKFE